MYVFLTAINTQAHAVRAAHPFPSRSREYTAISRKVVDKNVHATMPKGNMGYDQYTVPDTVAVKTSFVAFL